MGNRLGNVIYQLKGEVMVLGSSGHSKMIGIALTAFAALSIVWAGNITAGEKKQLSYPEVGLTTSFQILHPSAGYWWGRKGIRLTGMYVNKDLHEFHINIGYALYDTKRVQHSINLLTSWIAGSDPGADYKYGATGLAYGLNFRGFFLEMGLARPWRDDLGNLANDPVVPCGYFGYIYRFRPK